MEFAWIFLPSFCAKEDTLGSLIENEEVNVGGEPSQASGAFSSPRTLIFTVGVIYSNILEPTIIVNTFKEDIRPPAQLLCHPQNDTQRRHRRTQLKVGRHH